MRNLAPILLLVSITAAAAEPIEISGIYLRYEGAEYKSALLPCSSDEVWWLEGGAAYNDLIEIYQASLKNEYGEILVSLRLSVTPTDRTKYPNSNYDASATVDSILSTSSNKSEIRECKNGANDA